MKANTFFINVVPPFKIFQTLGVKPISLGTKHTPFFSLVKINLPQYFLKNYGTSLAKSAGISWMAAYIVNNFDHIVIRSV